MKIVIITQNSPVYLAYFLDKFIGLISRDRHSIENIIVLSVCVDKNLLKETRTRYDFYGFVDSCVMSLYVLWNKLFSFPAYIFPALGCYSVGNVKRKYKIPEYKVDKERCQSF